MQQLYYSPRRKPSMEVLDALFDIAEGVSDQVEVVIQGVTTYGFQGSLRYEGYRTGFRIEIDDPAVLFPNKKSFTRAGANRKLLRHIEDHYVDIWETIRSFVEKVDEEIAARGAEETQQEA